MSRGFSILKWPCFHNNNKRIENLKIFPGHQSYYSLQMHRQHTSKLKKTCSKGTNLSINIKEVPFKSGNGMSMYSALNMAISSCQIYVVHSMLYLQGLIEDSLGDRLQSLRWKLKRLGDTLLFFLHWFYIQHCHREQERELSAWIVWQFIQSRPFVSGTESFALWKCKETTVLRQFTRLT